MDATINEMAKTLNSLTAKVESMENLLQVLVSQKGSGEGRYRSNDLEATPGETGCRSKPAEIVSVINRIVRRGSQRKVTDIRFLKNTDGDEPIWEKVSTAIDKTNLDGILLPDPHLSLDYGDICKLLQISSKRHRLTKESKAAIHHLQELRFTAEKDIQEKLNAWICSEQAQAIDTSSSPQQLPIFKYAELDMTKPTGKPDATCKVLPMKLEIKDIVGKHGPGLIEKEYDLLSQMFERVLTDAGHNELLKRVLCFGTSGRYGWILLLERSIHQQRSSEDSPFISQNLSLAKIEIEDIVPVWEELVCQKGNDPSYFMHEHLYYPVKQLLLHHRLFPGWCRLRVAQFRTSSVLLHVHVGDLTEGINTKQPDLCIKVSLSKNREVEILQDIHTRSSNLESSPVRYVLTTLNATLSTKDMNDFIDPDYLRVTYLSGRNPPYQLFKVHTSWWNPELVCRRECSAILMYYGEIFSGTINGTVKNLLRNCLSRIHDRGYWHTDIRPYNWLFFKNIPSLPESIFSYEVKDEMGKTKTIQGTPLLIDYDLSVKEEEGPNVETGRGERRAAMLDVTLDEDSHKEFQSIAWSRKNDEDMLALMLRGFPRRISSNYSLSLTQRLDAVNLNEVRVSMEDQKEAVSESTLKPVEVKAVGRSPCSNSNNSNNNSNETRVP